MSNVFTGVRAIFKIQGVQIAYASNCSYTINHNLGHTGYSVVANPISSVGRIAWVSSIFNNACTIRIKSDSGADTDSDFTFILVDETSPP